jgi:hypothetical protein
LDTSRSTMTNCMTILLLAVVAVGATSGIIA